MKNIELCTDVDFYIGDAKKEPEDANDSKEGNGGDDTDFWSAG